MIRVITLVSCALSMFIALVGMPRAAVANDYDVISCDASVAGGGNASWRVPVPDPGMSAYVDCPAGQGLTARSSYDGQSSGWLQGSYVYFDAPAGNTIDRVAFDAGLRRNDCGWGTEMVAGPYDLTGNVIFGLQANTTCDSQFQTPDEYTFFPIRFSYSAGAAQRVRIETRCGAPSCSRNGVAGIHIRNVDVQVRDDNAPTLAGGRGALLTSGGSDWLSGDQVAGFDADDPSGIRYMSIGIDGRELADQSNSCDFTKATPCGSGSESQSFATSAFGDGAHTITVSATDAAGNTSTGNHRVLVDNTAPDAPQNVVVATADGADAGATWQHTNDFNIGWTLPASAATGAPIVRAAWVLCSVDDPKNCTAPATADGAGITALQHVKVPGPGAWNMQLWLVDAAGNGTPRAAATGVTLRYDDASPTVSIAPPDPNDPTLIAAPWRDEGSGVTRGQIQIRHHPSGSWLTLPTSVSGDRIVARIDDVHLGDGVYDVEAIATDAAGNQGSSARPDGSVADTITLPLRLKTRLLTGLVVRHGTRARLARAAYARYGQLVRVRGRLTSPEGNPMQDFEVQAWTQVRDSLMPPRLIATVKTTRKGSFSFLVRKGPSRSIRIVYGGTSQIRSATKTLSLNVRSSTSMRPNHKTRVNGEGVRFHGRIRTGRIPQNGKIVEVQVFVRGKWRTFATTRAGQRGTWAYNYRFDGTRGNQTYRFRAKVPRETGYPFATGLSRIARVRVRGI